MVWREARLRALADSPSAFGSTLDREAAFADEEWQGRMELGATSDVSAMFLARLGDGGQGDAVDGTVVGMVGVITFDRPPGECEIVSMWTAPEARGRGVGALLVEACLDWARPRADLNRCALWVTRGNDGAQRLYERCGFVETGDVAPLPSDPCKDEIRMAQQV